MHVIINVFTVVLFLTTALTSFAQLQVTANGNATQLAQSLTGPGVVISNATMNCPAGASGTFNGTASNLGITSGVLLTTGDVDNAVGPNNASNKDTENGINFSDPDLVGAEPKATYDPCILEFDAVPSCSTLAFTFSFGSEEYMEYVNAQFNDIYGIFVTGPNPGGGTYVGYNMALLPPPAPPGTVVSIDNVNNNSYPQYYINNENPPGQTIQYDGFTKPITIAINVKPCASYHFKLAIADAGDDQLDSGVFFELKSLACNIPPIVLTTTTTPSICSANNGTATVNPVGGTLPYTYTWNTTPPQITQTVTGLASGTYSVLVQDNSGCFFNTATVTITGTGGFTSTITSTSSVCSANNGTATVTPSGGSLPYTYQWSPGGGTNAAATGLSVGNYTVAVADASGCTGSYSVTVTGTGGITSTLISTPTDCAAGNGTATVIPSGGSIPYTYQWSPSGGSNATATGLSAGVYTVAVTDANGCTGSYSVTVTTTGGISSTISSTPAMCMSGSGTATITPTTGTAPYTYQWAPGGGNDAIATGLGAGNYSVLVTDANGCTTSQTVTISQPAAITTTSSAVAASCGIKDGTATVSPAGGTPPYTYFWLIPPPIQTTATASGLGAGSYSVIITDANGCSHTPPPVTVAGAGSPIADFSINPEVVSILDPLAAFTDLSSGAIASWSWDFGDPASGANNSSFLQNPLHTYSDTGIYCITLLISDPKGICRDTIKKCLKVESPFTIYVPNSFTPNNNGINETFLAYGTFIKEYEMMIFDRWGNKVFESNDLSYGWNGKVTNKGDIVQEDAYIWKIYIVDTHNKSHNYIGRVTIVK